MTEIKYKALNDYFGEYSELRWLIYFNHGITFLYDDDKW